MTQARPRLTTKAKAATTPKRKAAKKKEQAEERPRLLATNKRALDQGTAGAVLLSRRSFAEHMEEAREAAIETWYERGGEWFIEWLEEEHRTQMGGKLHWREPFQKEFCLLMGNPWLENVLIEKSAQMGYTEILIALAGFGAARLRIPIGFGFEQQSKMNDIVPRLQQAFDFIEPIQRIRNVYKLATGRKDTDSKIRKLTIGGIDLTFFYASTSGTKKSKDAGKDGRAASSERQAASGLSSFTCFMLIADEIELWPDGVIEVALKRMQASYLPTKPFRGGSTPGHEGGTLDAQMRTCKYVFQWYFGCPHCGTNQFLDFFGNMLKPIEVEEDGISEIMYVDMTGKPIDWFCHDKSEPEVYCRDAKDKDAKVKTSYIGCQHCQQVITPEDMMSGMFLCTHTGRSLMDVCNETVENQEAIFDKVGLRLPRLASFLFKPAENMGKLIDSRNPADELQQRFGKCISIGMGKINLTRIMSCVGLPLPDELLGKKPDYITLGVDQGVAANWGIVQAWYLADGKKPELRWKEARKQTLWFGELFGVKGLEAKIEEYSVDLVGMDMEPERQFAGSFAHTRVPHMVKKGQTFLFDQVHLKGEEFRKSKRIVQGDEIAMYALHRTFGLDASRNRIYKRLHHLPPGLNYNPRDDKNFIHHFMTSERSTDGLWSEPEGAPDHYFHADNFSEMAMMVYFFEPKPYSFAFTSIKR